MSAAFEGLRAESKRWKYRALKAEGELEELRMTVHQFAACQGEPKEVARTQLHSVAIEYHQRLNTTGLELV